MHAVKLQQVINSGGPPMMQPALQQPRLQLTLVQHTLRINVQQHGHGPGGTALSRVLIGQF